MKLAFAYYLGTLIVLLQYDNMRNYHVAIDTSRNYFSVSLWQFEPSLLPVKLMTEHKKRVVQGHNSNLSKTTEVMHLGYSRGESRAR
jgi:hypothetical protein